MGGQASVMMMMIIIIIVIIKQLTFIECPPYVGNHDEYFT